MLARNSDPVSSHEAADEIVASGKQTQQKQSVLNALKSHMEEHGPATSAELARLFNMDRYMVARRLPDLEKDRAVVRRGMKRCSVSGKQATAWAQIA